MSNYTKPQRDIHSVFLHCSASDNPAHDSVAVINEWHLARGWSGCGYHYFIKADGTVQLGRSTALVPAAQKGHNEGTIAICLHGHKTFTQAQMKSLRALCKEIDLAHSEEGTSRIRFRGHCEVSPKACPVFPYAKVLGLLEGGFLPRVQPVPEPETNTLQELRQLQKELVAVQVRLGALLDTLSDKK